MKLAKIKLWITILENNMDLSRLKVTAFETNKNNNKYINIFCIGKLTNLWHGKLIAIYYALSIYYKHNCFCCVVLCCVVLCCVVLCCVVLCCVVLCCVVLCCVVLCCVVLCCVVLCCVVLCCVVLCCVVLCCVVLCCVVLCFFFNGHRLMVDRSSSKRCVPIRIRLAVLYYYFIT